MRLFPETGELVQETEAYTHKQDNNQSSQQANSQNIALYLPQSVPCVGNSIFLEIKDKISDPLPGEEVCVLWNGTPVSKGITDSTGKFTCTEIPCGYYQIKIKNCLTSIKLLGNQKKEIVIFI
jgi:hypothetical protein